MLEVPQLTNLMLTRGGPDVLQQPVLLSKPIQGVVALAHGPNETAQRICDVLASVAAGLVNLSNRDLNGCVVLGLDDAVGGTALTRDVTARGPDQYAAYGIEDSGRVVEDGGGAYRSTSSPVYQN